MPGKTPTRADDDRLLEMIARRARGEPASAIGRDLGVTKSAVLGATFRVREHDLLESCPPEDRDEVIRAYQEPLA